MDGCAGLASSCEFFNGWLWEGERWLLFATRLRTFLQLPTLLKQGLRFGDFPDLVKTKRMRGRRRRNSEQLPAESRWDLCSEAQQWETCSSTKTISMPTHTHWVAARREEFPHTSSPHLITPRDGISRSGNPSGSSWNVGPVLIGPNIKISKNVKNILETIRWKLSCCIISSHVFCRYFAFVSHVPCNFHLPWNIQKINKLWPSFTCL